MVVAVGETLRVPLTGTVPSELMLTESAFCTLHCKVELCPAVMLAGVAVLVIAAAVATLVQTYRVGDSGARAAWGNVTSSAP